ncbi:hypothetical protein ACEZDB_14255 [Streptacidiphilus sp. N1-3]|uniref:Uncharacterized protein n=1 Tax=Streptacidiphilus alkalitolerans TaxID=3342712 RepID=A0ABV6X0L8_9ACTN
MDQSDGDIVQVTLVLVTDVESSPEETERLNRRLRVELGQIDLESLATLPGGRVPDGAKATDPVTVGAILVGLSASGGVLSALVVLLGDWLERQSRRHRISVTIDGDTLELERASAEEQRDVVAAFLRRHPVS